MKFETDWRIILNELKIKGYVGNINNNNGKPSGFDIVYEIVQLIIYKDLKSKQHGVDKKIDTDA